MFIGGTCGKDNVDNCNAIYFLLRRPLGHNAICHINVLMHLLCEKAGMSLTKINGFHYYCNDTFVLNTGDARFIKSESTNYLTQNIAANDYLIKAKQNSIIWAA